MTEETLTHHLVLPRDANHHGTLYAGALMSLALEAGYAAAFRAVGDSANLVLKRVLDLRCYKPVRVGQVVEIRGKEVHRARAFVIVALYGSPLKNSSRAWMDGLMQFVQIDGAGRPEPLEGEPPLKEAELPEPWATYQRRARQLLSVRA